MAGTLGGSDRSMLNDGLIEDGSGAFRSALRAGGMAPAVDDQTGDEGAQTGGAVALDLGDGSVTGVDFAAAGQSGGLSLASNVQEGFFVDFSSGPSLSFSAARAGSTAAAASDIDLSSLGKLHMGLANIFAEAETRVAGLDGADRSLALIDFTSANTMALVNGGMVAIDAVAANGDGAALLVQLEALGMVSGASYGAMAGGYIPIDSLDEVAALDSLNFAQPVYLQQHVGAVTSQAVNAMYADAALAGHPGITGAGVTVGVISDSFNTKTGTTIHYAQDVASGDLPANMRILSDSPNGTDEGRAMAQGVHDIAPGADIAFSSANPSQAAFANSILNLAKPVAQGGGGADIIVDDVVYFAEPMFQDGIIAQAVNTVTANGVMYFSSAGNEGTFSYEGHNLADSGLAFNWTGSANPANNGLFHLLDFDPGAGVDYIQTLNKTTNDTLNFLLSWDQPSASAGGAGSASDLAIFLFLGANPNQITNVVQVNNLGGNAFEAFGLGAGTGTFGIAIGVRDGNPMPGTVKWVGEGGSLVAEEYATNSATAFGHNNATDAVSVGAAFWAETARYGFNAIPGQPFPYAEYYSSKGGIPILFDNAGNRLASPIDRGGVDITAPDGGDTTFFGQQLNDGNTFPNFFGTSQAAPNAAAVAALLMQAFPTATNAQILTALKASAHDIVTNDDAPPQSTNAGIGIGNDLTTGAGLIDANAAFTTLAAMLAAVDTPPVVLGSADLAGAVTELVTPVGNLTDTGIITFTDADGAAAHVVTNGFPVGTTLGSLTASILSQTAADGSGGQVQWTYSVAASAVEYLAAGQTKVEQFAVILDDETIYVNATITGTNDVPVVTVTGSDSANASLTEANAGLTGTGTLTVVDADLSDSVTPTVQSVTASGTTAGLASSNAALKAMLSIAQASIAADSGSSHNLTWNFNSGSEAFNYLNAGQALTLTYAVQVADGHGGTATQNVTVSITGANDAPTLDIVSSSDSASASVTDGTSNLLVHGTLTAVDADLSDSVTATVLGVTISPGGPGNDFAILSMMSVAPTHLAADPTSPANLGWSFSAGANFFDYLGAGQVQTLTYHVVVTDEHGATALKDVVINVTGTNEAPSVTGSVPAATAVVELPDGSAGENSAVLTGNGTIHFNDSDYTDTHGAGVTANGTGYLGNFMLGPVNDAAGKVSWTFAVSDGVLNTLGAGQVVHQDYTVTVSDGHGGTSNTVIGVDLIGSNDAAVLSSANVVVNQGLVPATANGTLTISDEDGPAAFQALSNVHGSYGSLSLAANGQWSYVADNALLNIAAGQVVTDSFTVHAADGTPTTVAVSIAGSNDIAIAQLDHFSTSEAATLGSGLSLFADNGNGADNDPDGPPLQVSAVNGDAAFVGHQLHLASGALLTVNANGTFSYDPNHAFDSLTLASGAVNQSAFDSFTYTLAGGTTATVLVDVTGVSSAQDRLDGSLGDNAITGFNTADTFLLQQGGTDSAYGLGGNDGFYFGGAFDGGDAVDGGDGTDTIALQGNTHATLGDVSGVEVLVALSGSDPSYGDTAGNSYSYDIATQDSNVAAGQTLTVIGTGLQPGENMSFDGSAETDGNFRIFAGQGVDDLTGGGGSDGFFFGANGNLTGADHVDGGAGVDTLALRGNYAGANAVVFTDSSLANVEVVAMFSGHATDFGGQVEPAGFDYDLTMANGNVAAGQHLDIVASGLAGDESVRFDGRAETDGSFRIFSGAGADSLYGGSGNDLLYGGLGADRLEGGAGADTYAYTSAAESTGTGYDQIVGFDWHVDHIDTPGGARAFTQSAGGALSTASFDADLSADLGGVLGANGAVLFTANSGTLAGHLFAVIDGNGVAGYQAGADFVIELVNPVMPIDTHAMVIA